MNKDDSARDPEWNSTVEVSIKFVTKWGDYTTVERQHYSSEDEGRDVDLIAAVLASCLIRSLNYRAWLDKCIARLICDVRDHLDAESIKFDHDMSQAAEACLKKNE